MLSGEFLHSSPALLASLLAATIATLGLLTVALNGEWASRHKAYFSAFAAGILVTTAIILMPAGIAAGSGLGLYGILLGYFGLYFINFIFSPENRVGFVIAPIFAIGLHSFIDGIEYGILFRHEIMIGLMASIGLITHEFAEAVILFLLLKTAGVSTRLALLGAFIGAALTTPLGTLAAQLYLNDMPGEKTGMLLAIAGGALLYVGATHLPGHMRGSGSRKTLFAYALGVVLALCLNLTHHMVEGTNPFHDGILPLHDGHDHNGHHHGKSFYPLL